MKKVKNFLLGNIKTMIAFVVGGIVLGGTVTVIAVTAMASSEVSYTPPSGSSATNVQDALDEIYTKTNTWINPSTIQTDSSGKILASSRGIIIRRNGQTHLIRNNNWSVEKNHIQQIFSDGSCDVSSFEVICYASDFYCRVSDDGIVYYYDYIDDSYCIVPGDGSVTCY